MHPAPHPDVSALPRADLIIAGRATTASAAQHGEVRSPATGEVVGTFAWAAPEQVEAAVQAAERSWRIWARVPAHERETVIRRATAHARTQADRIGRLMALEQGKPYAQSRAEVTGACDVIDFYATEAPRIAGEINQTEKASLRSWVIRQPVGVVAAITPWNYPVALLAWKLGPALAAGCSMVVKPNCVTPLSPVAFCQALVDGGLPAGLISALVGDDLAIGTALVAHPLVAKVAFTGSTSTGKAIMRAAGPLLKKITLELGGHCPAIVCPDADLPAAAKAIAYKAFRNMGQSCSSINRIYAHASIHDALVELVAAEGRTMTIGDGLVPPDSDLGPMTTATALAKVRTHVADALAKGARLVSGGDAPPGRAGVGNFYMPTVLTGCTHEMLVMRDETFGPVAPFMTYQDPEDALRWANDSDYGLCAFVFTRDLKQTVQLSERLETGTVCVNHVGVNTAYGPYEGWKNSGFGVELGRDAMGEYLKRKHIKIDLG
ncbi:MAG: aldehyde dehydrogenase family protein [Planctomycetes bacterium]|nr:aldehyde dehydrogenase family protein [Planctomycetota bacterium]